MESNFFFLFQCFFPEFLISWVNFQVQLQLEIHVKAMPEGMCLNICLIREMTTSLHGLTFTIFTFHLLTVVLLIEP